jgi:hypothetical protein
MRTMDHEDDAYRAALRATAELQARREQMLARNAAIGASFLAGASVMDLARAHGISYERVRQILARDGVCRTTANPANLWGRSVTCRRERL